jgi:drug/metabolite transporter (DMT)-like permease
MFVVKEKMADILWLIYSSSCAAMSIIFVKYFVDTKKYIYIILAILSEIGLIYGYIHLLKYSSILVQYTLVKIISILLVFIATLFLFKTELSWRKGLGILLAILAIFLL